MNSKPLTPLLDALESERAEREQWEAEAEARESARVARVQAEAAARAERVRRAREQKSQCEKAVRDADAAAAALVDALGRYLASVPVPPVHVQARIGSFLHQYFAGRFGPIQSNGAPDLMADLRWEVT